MTRLRNPGSFMGARVERVGRTLDGNYEFRGVTIRYGSPMTIEWPDGDETTATSLTHARHQINDAFIAGKRGVERDTPET